MAALGTIVAVVVGLREARRTASMGLLIELAVVVVAGGWLSAKIGHVLFEATGHALPGGRVAAGVVDLLRADPWHWARLLEPGYVQFAGVFGAVMLGLLFLWRQGQQALVPAMADAAAVAVAVGVALGRVGCFLAGCCHGAATDVAWAVRFPVDHVTGGSPVHPTQLYDAIVAAGAIALWVLLRGRRAPGVAAVVVATVLLVGRLVTEVVRADVDRGAFGPVSTSQGLALVALIVLWSFVFLHRRRRALDAGAEAAIVPAPPERG